MYQLIQVGISNLKSKTKSPTYKETLANYVEVIKMDGSFAWLFNCMVCSGFIMSGVFRMQSFRDLAELPGMYYIWQLKTSLLMWVSLQGLPAKKLSRLNPSSDESLTNSTLSSCTIFRMSVSNGSFLPCLINFSSCLR